jgi:hypothetical protein
LTARIPSGKVLDCMKLALIKLPARSVHLGGAGLANDNQALVQSTGGILLAQHDPIRSVWLRPPLAKAVVAGPSWLKWGCPEYPMSM